MPTQTISMEQHIEETSQLKQEIVVLEEQLEWLKRQIFGQRSEKFITPPDSQPTLFDFPTPPEPEKIEVRPYRRPKSSKGTDSISFPKDLPIERTVLDLPENQKVCQETRKSLVKIGEEVSQKLAFRPGSYFIKEVIRPKYALPKGSGEGICVAPLPESLLHKCKADESLLAEILVRKFSDHLPLYRQSEIMARDDVFISRQVLSKWVIRCGLALKPLYNRLMKEVLESQNVFIDEVPVDMLKPGLGKTHKAYMWVMVGGKSANPALRVYSFRDNRRHINAEELLKGLKTGVVHSDKYGAYEVLANKKTFIWSPCWAHIRRKFFEAEGGDSKFAELVLRKIRYLFMFERVAWSRSEDERLRIRQNKEVPIIDELIELIKGRLVYGRALPKSKFKEALGYFTGLIPHLKNYTTHPFARMDNNVAERAVRPLALGRKNWLFLGNEKSGEASAVLLSLIQTCKALGKNPRDYLESVMRRLMSHSSQKIDELLPHNWDPS